ncbi:cytochrome c biogenesis protein ResB [Bacillus solimangrovi]|uniref:Cytochrome C biogenesis protein n=1 Tax=Bacillus solimangrovi TaxID=1305675 RepID=A0A1E5LHI1_9BACI|nr:cytochrome c biogenesis protein ResB [Bacillus solimangrovi]OEH93527.1 cytochrome C biogenesis protein [Bacillus solimangrovi]
MEKVKCQCGHVNPHGTLLCESCGNPLEEVDKELLDMRYDGSARRSQTYKKTIVDKIWNFFSSVKVGVWLIVITLVASSLGTILPQEMYIPPTESPAIFYEKEYGFVGKLYYTLGFHNLYGSWWYMLMVASIAISLVICSLDRVIPLHRALKNQSEKKHDNFLKRQRVFGVTETANSESSYNQIEEALKKKRYHIREKDGNLLAEKGRFSRWGPYVNHIGLIIFLIGAMLRFFPGMYIDETLWLRDGETKAIPGTDGEYYLQSNGFVRELYSEEDGFEVGMGTAKNFQTNVTLYKTNDSRLPGQEAELEEVKSHEIRVNEPLKFEGFAVYQVSYKLDEFKSMSFELENKQTGETFGDLTVMLEEPEQVYDLGNGYRVELMNYFPDFYFDEDGNPATQTRLPNNPAFVFKMFTPETPEGEISFVGIRLNVEPIGDNDYKMSFSGIDTQNATALTIRLDRTLWIIGIGGVIFMLGVIQGMYWNHRRIWLKRKQGEVWIAGHTNKNWFGLKKDIEFALIGTDINMPIDQSEDKKDKKMS